MIEPVEVIRVLSEHTLKREWRSIYRTVFVFGLAILNTCVVRLIPSPINLASAVIAWASAWVSVNASLAFVVRNRMILAAERADDNQRLASIYRISLWRHMLTLALFRDPERLYR